MPDESPKNRKDGVPRGRVRRAAPVAGLTAQTTGAAVVASLRRRVTGKEDSQRHVRAAARYAELLGHSKGALMKAGQAISFVSLGPAVPPEFQTAYQSALARLRDDAPPMSAELAREVLEAELGQRVEQAFASFDSEPLAAASIGQVHAARLRDGRGVAVKVQYPGVADAIRADLANTELLATFLHLMISISPRRMRLDPRTIARELGAHIADELDYCLEAERQSRFVELYRGHPFVHVPEVIEDLSTGRVLVQELVQGRSWSDALGAGQQLRDRWAEAIVRFAYGSVNHFRMFNADPHPGNYLFHDDGSVSFLDFGCVKIIDEQMTALTTEVVRACLRGDAEATWRASVKAGLFRESDPVDREAVFEYWREPLRWYWDEQPFSVTPECVAAVTRRRNSPTGPSAEVLRYLQAAPGATILGRMDTEVMSVIAQLRATGLWGSIAAEFYEEQPPVTEMGKLEHAFLTRHPAAIVHA
ncbi:MAG: AarF/ABC1/UbiB kinase family protein [Solirubrobacterales bacterium]|nr:AarF/ABC1/UbiB kinase family protein [Solirubrobacterales bacterium]